MKKTGNSESPPARVRILPEHVTRKIAAGEVIDRPHAVVRELLDNAIDTDADEISLSLENGGIDSVVVSDNGWGMELEDLASCWLAHATSKIASIDDLDLVKTLGFRGEALSSMAACARLEITTNRDGEASRLTVHGGKLHDVGPHPAAPGTTVSVRDLFYNLPARRRFLKSGRGETILCRKVFSEKAAAHPWISFRLLIDGKMKSYFPCGSYLERIQSAWPRLAAPGSYWKTEAHGDEFDFTIIHTRPEISRKNRQYIQIYANRRRIDEFSLVQGVRHAYDAWMPGGNFPIAFVFIEIDPCLVDFNIHPAKKEARFRDISSLRHLIIDSIKEQLNAESHWKRYAGAEASQGLHDAQRNIFGTSEIAESYGGYRATRNTTGTFIPSGMNAASKAPREESEEFGETVRRLREEQVHSKPLGGSVSTAVQKDSALRYLGQAMGVFLVAECAGSLFIVDQHAAHERILFEKFKKTKGSSERLLIPREIHPEKESLMKLELRKERLAALGVELKTDGDTCFLHSIPHAARGMENDIIAFLERSGGDAEELEKALWADLACKAAVKDNHVLDDTSAYKLLQKTFALEEKPRCPHGRPIWFEISRNDLFGLVGRT